MKTRACKHCCYWKEDRGMWTMTGWTGTGRNEGYCHYEPRPIRKGGDDFCRHCKEARDGREED